MDHKEVVSLHQKYVVRLTDEERGELQLVIKKWKGSGQKVRRAHILLKTDADGPNWTDQQIAEAFSCRTRTVEGIRQRLVERGFQETLDRAQRPSPPTAKLLDGKQEARIIATRLGSPPKGYANWSLRLLARKVVELEIVESVSRETVRRTLKKRHDESQNRVLGQETEHRRRKPTPDPEGAPVANREEVLETYEKPYDPACPVICIDKQPVQLLTPVFGCGEVASFHRVGNAPRVEWQVSAGPRSTRDALPTR